MSTAGDMLKTRRSVDQLVTLFGADEGFMSELSERRQAIGRAFCEEQGVEYGVDSGTLFPPETPLGEKSQKLFDDLEEWLAAKHPSLSLKKR